MKKKYCGAFFLSDLLTYSLAAIFLTAIAWPGIRAYLDASKNDKAQADTAMICGRISQYRFEVGSYPATLAALEHSVGQYGPWLRDLPEDPWSNGNTYQYLQNANGCIVFSVGRNGAANSTVAAGIGGDDVGYFFK